MTDRESDQPIVLRGRESRPHGEGADRYTQPAKETLPGHGGSDTAMPTSLLGIANKVKNQKQPRYWGWRWSEPIAEASISEEPGAGIPHAGICAGGAG